MFGVTDDELRDLVVSRLSSSTSDIMISRPRKGSSMFIGVAEPGNDSERRTDGDCYNERRLESISALC